MYNKQDIDKTAEQEAIALKRQGKQTNCNNKRLKLQAEYNKKEFDRLFRR